MHPRMFGWQTIIVLLCAIAVAGCPERNNDRDTGTVVDEDTATSDVADGGDAGGDADDVSDTGGPCSEVDCGEGATCNPETSLCEVEVDSQCKSADPWSSGTEAFRDASEDWGLADIAPEAVRISVTDLEGDGWPDLVLRQAKDAPNKFGEAGKRRVWLLRNTGDGSFEDVTKSSKLLTSRVSGSENISRPAQVIVWGDVDNDGDLDAYTGFNKKNSDGPIEDSAEIMLNNGDGTFELGPTGNAIRSSGSANLVSSATFLDYNRDGNLDLWVTRYQLGERPPRDQLYRGNGDGTFENVTEEAGIDSQDWSNGIAPRNNGKAHSLAWSGNACDLNDDGVPELLAGSYGRAPNHLWRGTSGEDGIGYENISVASGYAYDDRTDWSDNASARCYCKLNPDATGCEDVPDPQRIPCESESDVFRWNHASDREPYRLGGNTGTTVCADIDRDGQLDLLTNEIVHWDVGASSDPSEILYNRQGDEIRFERPGREATGLTREHELQAWNEGDITSGIFDFDNDGRPDIYIGSTDYPGTRGLLYHQTTDGTFESVPVDEGIDHTSSHGIGLADFDRDGDIDVVVGHSDNRCGSGDHCYPDGEKHVRLFENRVGQDANWLQLTLVGGEGTNRAAIGARVEVETDTGTQVQEVGGGHGHYGIQHDMTLHFGLGEACEAKVTVRWPNQELTERTFVLKPGHRYRWKQGETPVVADVE